MGDAREKPDEGTPEEAAAGMFDKPGDTLTGARKDAFVQTLLVEANCAEVKAALLVEGSPDRKVQLNAEAGLVGASASITAMRAAIKEIGAKSKTGK